MKVVVDDTFELRFGFYSFAVVSLAVKVTLLTLFGCLASLVDDIVPAIHNSGLLADCLLVTFGTGYIFVMAFALYTIVQGMTLEKSVLIFPYFIVLVIEIILTAVCHFYLVLLTPIFVLSFLIAVGVELYVFHYTWTLYVMLREAEKKNKSVVGAPIIYI